MGQRRLGSRLHLLAVPRAPRLFRAAESRRALFGLGALLVGERRLHLSEGHHPGAATLHALAHRATLAALAGTTFAAEVAVTLVGAGADWRAAENPTLATLTTGRWRPVPYNQLTLSANREGEDLGGGVCIDKEIKLRWRQQSATDLRWYIMQMRGEMVHWGEGRDED